MKKLISELTDILVPGMLALILYNQTDDWVWAVFASFCGILIIVVVAVWLLFLIATWRWDRRNRL